MIDKVMFTDDDSAGMKTGMAYGAFEDLSKFKGLGNEGIT